MNKAKYFIIFFISLAASFNTNAEVGAPEKKAADHISFLLEGITSAESKDERKYYLFEKPGPDVFAVLMKFGYIGGNGRQFYLSVFEKECELIRSPSEKGAFVCDGEPRYRLIATELIGEVSELAEKLREVDMSYLEFSNNTFKIKVRSYKPGDPMCCPTDEQIVTYTLDGRKLIEL